MSDVWHTPPETPNVFKPQPIIVVYEAGDQIEQMASTEWNGLVGERYVNRWCYVDDLIKENDRTSKALDFAVAGLEKMTWGCDSSDAESLLKEITALEQKDK